MGSRINQHPKPPKELNFERNYLTKNDLEERKE